MDLLEKIYEKDNTAVAQAFADMVYIPKQGVEKPALLVELKYNQSAITAIDQIKQKNYSRIFHDYKGEVLLVGINYDKDTKTHQCQIETMNSQSQRT